MCPLTHKVDTSLNYQLSRMCFAALGISREIAMKRFCNLEKRFNHDLKLKSVTELLRRGRFELSKWSNCRGLLRYDVDSGRGVLLIRESGSRVLRIVWDPSKDNFRFAYDYSLPIASGNGRFCRRSRIYLIRWNCWWQLIL